MATVNISEIMEEKFIEIERNPWNDNFFRPLLIIGMIMCLNISVVNFVRLANPDWRSIYFLVAMFLTTVEGIYSYRILQSYTARGISVARYRLAELLILILIVKLLGYMGKSFPLVMAELQSSWQTPAIFFLNSEFLTSFLLALLAWGAATQTIADFETLYDPYTDNRATLQALTERFFWGGGALVLISGVTQWVIRSDSGVRAGLSSLVDWQRPSLSGVILNVLIYFSLGLILLGQVNLSRLMIYWRTQNITIPPELARRWARYGLTFLGLVTLIAFVLPTRYTLGFLATASIAVQFLIDIFVLIFQLLLLLITLPLAWLLSLFGITWSGRGGGVGAPPPILPTEAGPTYPWLEVLRSLIFWIVALTVGGYLLKTYLEDHPELVEALKKFRPFNLLSKLLIALWLLIKNWVRTGLEMLPMPAGGLSQDQSGRGRERGYWFGFRTLSPQARILYYYLNILERAKKRGPDRKQHQTPYEYEPSLSHAVPEVQAEVHDLTDTFVQARYSQNNFSEEEAALVKQEWQKIRKALRHKPNTK